MTHEAEPLVVVGVPVRDGAAYLAECLASLCDQTRPPDVIVVSDNASRDGSVAIATSFRAHHPDLRIRRHHADIGAAANFNQLVTTTRSTYFSWMAHDDLWDPTLLERALDVLESDPRVAVAHGQAVWIDADGRPCGAPPTPLWSDSDDAVTRVRELLADDEATHLHDCNAVMGVMRRTALETTRLVRAFPGADKALIFELALRGRITELTGARFHRRVHPGSSVAANPHPDARQRWFDPHHTRPATPTVDLVRAFLGATVATTHLSAADRVRVAGLVAAWATRSRRPRVIAGEIRRLLRHRITRRP